MATKSVVMYTTSWCGDCRAAKRFLDSRGISYQEINIEHTPGAAEQVERWARGYRTVPTFNIDGKIVVDFDRRALEEALAS
jgi:glutaredoxin